MRATGEPGATPGELSDAQLVVGVARYNEDALAELYRRHAPAVLALARRVTGEAGTAEDVVQEVFLRLWNQPERFDPDRGSLRSFLLAQSHSRSVDIVRSRSARARREEHDARDAANAGYDLEHEVWDLAVADQLAQALASLPKDERTAIELAYYDGHTYREVATILSQPEGTVKSRIRNGLRRMRNALAESGEGTMSTDTEHDEIEELLGAYVLDGIDPDEVVEVERHLAGCPRCRAEVDAGREVAGQLGTSVRVGDVGPLPAGLWDRIAEGVAASARRDPGPMPGLGDDGDRGAPVVRIDEARVRRTKRGVAAWVVAAVGTAAVVAVVVLGVALARTTTELHQGGQRAAVRAALATPHHRVVHLTAPDGTELAEFVVLPSGQGYMVSSKMPALPTDETYQLWAIISGKPISVGLLGHQPQRATFTLASTATPSELAVTVEPAAGVTAPTQAPVASGELR